MIKDPIPTSTFVNCADSSALISNSRNPAVGNTDGLVLKICPLGRPSEDDGVPFLYFAHIHNLCRNFPAMSETDQGIQTGDPDQ